MLLGNLPMWKKKIKTNIILPRSEGRKLFRIGGFLFVFFLFFFESEMEKAIFTGVLWGFLQLSLRLSLLKQSGESLLSFVVSSSGVIKLQTST